MENEEQNSFFECVSVPIGMFIGGVLGFIIFKFLPNDASFLLEMAARFFILLFSLVGWLLLLLAQGRGFYCGGREAVANNSRLINYVFVIFLVLCLIFLTALLLTDNLLCFFGTIFFVLSLILGVVGRNDPMYVLKGKWV